LQDFLRKNRNVLHLEFLPAYSPELNPIERVWKVTRKICTHNVYFEKLEQVTDSVTKQHDVWRKPNETLRRLCCIT
jgi:transposase